MPKTSSNTASLTTEPATPIPGGNNDQQSEDFGESGGATSAVAVTGAAVKGPLVYAMVTAYRINTAAYDLKGDAVAIGMTDQNAALQLNIPKSMLADGPFLLEYAEGKELDGSVPAIPLLTTLITNEQLLAGTPVYATPITSFILQHARSLADQVDNRTRIEPASDGLQGDGNGEISATEFAAALTVASQHVKATLGAGLLPQAMNLFTTSPILSTHSDQQDSLRYRAASETFAAFIVELQRLSAKAGKNLNANDLINALALDLSDGSFDGKSGLEDIPSLSAINDVAGVISTDPNSLLVPGTTVTIGGVDSLLEAEAPRVAPDVVVGTLTMPTLQEASSSLVEIEQPNTPEPEPPEPAPAPEPTPIPEPTPAPEPAPAPAPTPAPEAKTKSLTLRWTAPSVRENGDYLSLGEISGYEIYYTTENSEESVSIIVDGGNVNNYALSPLTPDIYYFSMSAIDTGQLKSKMSAVVEVDLQ